MRITISWKRDSILERKKRFLDWSIELERHNKLDETWGSTQSGAEEQGSKWDSEYANVKVGGN